MDYNKANKADIDGSGNIVLQDVQGGSVTINYNDTEAMKALFRQLGEEQLFAIKQMIGRQHEEVLKEIRTMQEQMDAQKTDKQAEEVTASLDEFFREIHAMKIDNAKNRLKKNYRLLREYEELLILEDDPRRKKKYEYEIAAIKEVIEKIEHELKSIA